MITYIVILLILIVLYFYNEKEHIPQSKIQLRYIMLFLALFVGFSDMLGGYDRYIYAELFDEIANITRNNGNYSFSGLFTNYFSEPGYCIWNVLISFITANRYIFIFATTLLIYLLLYNAIKNYTTNYVFAIIIFMALMFFFTFTYLRQILATAIVWFSVKYILDRKPIKFSLIILIAALFHNSALIFFPLYFIPLIKIKKNYIIPIMFICLIIGISGLPAMVFNIYGAAVDESRGAGFAATAEIGFRFAYLIEAIFFLIPILSSYEKIPNSKGAALMLNISIIFCAILLIFILSENGGRLSWFFMIGIISTITRIAASKFSTYRNIILGTCIFLYLRILISWGILLYPYKTFFSNGVRQGDFIEQKYEYDSEYQYDKFYR